METLIPQPLASFETDLARLPERPAVRSTLTAPVAGSPDDARLRERKLVRFARAVRHRDEVLSCGRAHDTVTHEVRSMHHGLSQSP